MRILSVTLAVLLSLTAGQAIAKNDIMPPPRKAPRIPVEQLTLYEATESYTPPPKPGAIKPPSKIVVAKAINPTQPTKSGKISPDLKDAKELEGMAKALDGERLLVGEREVRLFGIVTPSIGSNYGPQAKQKLDSIIKGEVLCKITDKDVDGRPIAFCGTVDTPDLSYEMLRQGWAMVDRKALKNNTLAEVYEKVEQQAQAQNKGLFAPMPMVTSIPLSNPTNTVTVPLVSPTAVDPNKPTPEKQEEAKAPEPSKTTEIVKDVPGTALSFVQRTEARPVTAPVKAEAKAETPVVAPTPAKSEPATETISEKPAATNGPGFFERYQGIIGGILWIFGVLAVGGVFVLRDRVQLKEKRRALAAALNGELTSARHICRARARELNKRRHMGEDDSHLRPSQLWPKIRALVYQAHVGSIGLLGSDLARRVASIYGQCADYAVYYQQTGMQRLPSSAAVSETLTNLADYIDNILDSLAWVEQTGQPFLVDTSEQPMVNENFEPTKEAQARELARNSVNEEAQAVKERFERMATAMVGMLGRKREGVDPVVAASSEPAGHPTPAHEAPGQGVAAAPAPHAEAQPAPKQDEATSAPSEVSPSQAA